MGYAGTGTFTQTGGTSAMDNLFLGYASSAAAPTI